MCGDKMSVKSRTHCLYLHFK